MNAIKYCYRPGTSLWVQLHEGYMRATCTSIPTTCCRTHMVRSRTKQQTSHWLFKQSASAEEKAKLVENVSNWIETNAMTLKNLTNVLLWRHVSPISSHKLLWRHPYMATSHAQCCDVTRTGRPATHNSVTSPVHDDQPHTMLWRRPYMTTSHTQFCDVTRTLRPATHNAVTSPIHNHQQHGMLWRHPYMTTSHTHSAVTSHIPDDHPKKSTIFKPYH